MTPDTIKSLRAGLKLTQAQFAAQLGVTRRTIINWEVGHVSPSALAQVVMRRLEPDMEADPFVPVPELTPEPPAPRAPKLVRSTAPPLRKLKGQA